MKKPHFGLKRVTSRDPYQSIDLIEYYKSYNRHKELGRGRQALEGAKVNFSLFDFLQFLRSFLTKLDLLSRRVLVSSIACVIDCWNNHI